MNDWNLWLNSRETREAIKIVNESIEELRDLITDGSHVQEMKSDKIALEYTYSLGQLEGMRTVVDMIKDIASLVDEKGE